MTIEWSTTDKEGSANGIKCMVYGGAGAGKTTLCGTAPAPVIISAEAGLLSLRNARADYGNGPEPIRVMKVAVVQDVWDALSWCQEHAKKSGIKTICLDSISEIVEKILSNEKKKTADPRKAYGEMATIAIDIVKAFRDLPGLHVLVTAKETTGTDPISGVAKAQPNAPGQMVGPSLPYLFDEVFHAATDKDAQGKTYHYLRTRKGFNADAKDRSGVLDEIEWPDLTNIFNKILQTQAAQGTA